MYSVPRPADNGGRDGPCVPCAEIYRHAIEEYRFEVRLSWERTKFYLGLNMALLAAVATLLRIDSDSWWPPIGVSIVGLLVSGLGVSTIRTGHNYYRRTVWKKTLIEDALGLNEPVGSQTDQYGTWAIATTASQEDTNAILQDKNTWIARKIEPQKITWKLIALMRVFIVLHVVVIGFAVWRLSPVIVACWVC